MFRIEDTLSPNDFGVNKGEAQVLDQKPAFENMRFERELQARKDIAQEKAKQGVEQEKKTADAKRYSDIAGLKSIAILPADRDIFAAKQKAVSDYVYQNARALHEGDPKANMEFQNLYADLSSSAERSKNFREGLEAKIKEIDTNGESSFYPEDVQNIKNLYNTPNDGSYNIGGALLNKRFNTQQYIQSTLRPIVEDIANKGSHDYVDPQSGVKTTYTKDNLTPQESDKIFASSMLKNPLVFKEESHNLANDPEAKKQFGTDVNAYIKDKYYNQFVVNRDKTSIDEGRNDYGGNDSIETASVDKPQSYVIKSPSTGGGTKDATIDVAQSATLSKPISIDLTMTTSVRDLNGNALPKNKGVFKVSGSDLKVVPVYKTGTMSEKNTEGKTIDMGGNIIPSERLADAKSKGVIEYKPMFYGTAKVPEVDENGTQKWKVDANGNETPLFKEISITKPANELKGALGKSVKTLDQMNAYAEQLNKGNGSNKTYTKAQEENINIVLNNPKNKGITREKVIEALKY